MGGKGRTTGPGGAPVPRVAGEEKLHAVWLRELYDDIGVPSRNEDTQRCDRCAQYHQANCDRLIAMNPQGRD